MELRERIIKAAEQVIQEKGLAYTTTKEIARTAGCSEGSLYNNFESKEDVFLHVLRGQLRNFMGILKSLRDRIGNGTVRSHLDEVANAAVEDYYYSTPLMAAVFSEPGLLSRHREGFTERNEGPHRANEAVEAYLRGEQQLGRLSEHVDPRAAADMLLGSCFQYSFQRRFLGEELSSEAKTRFTKQLLDTLFQVLTSDRDN
ncbi:MULTISPECIES: TetR/AcrR family transcriptional regulator [Bacillus]|uniref:AcrR family transcriptional regulator n=1 Tax=Bacillus capparidis TaxID=1840411 RepID=A0ABS4D2G5_9BACI|nr:MULTISPECIES: TetR/AcrR family transcriptional regulator [Bacillus]MBP1083818.1 AcrR family transcriptional regulator [Bacillus capparidis]MED1098301.1 TetR/AcrR family transcriptional regulator [Bacillus capparidis]